MKVKIHLETRIDMESLTFDKGAKATQWSEESFRQMELEQLNSHVQKKKMNVDTDLMSFTKINSDSITDPDINKIIKLQEDNRRKLRCPRIRR